MQSNQMQDQNESDPVSTFKINKSYSQRDQSISFIQLAKLHLQEYQDIDQNEFEVLDQQQNQNTSNILTNTMTTPTNYLKPHTTFVPIGTNFQTEIPEIISSKTYVQSKENKKNVQRLKLLKIHDTQSGSSFYQQYKNAIDGVFGGDRSYEEIAWLRKSMQVMVGGDGDGDGRGVGFQGYIGMDKVRKVWQELFKERDSQMQRRLKKKKKKYKGSMDI